MLDILIYTLLYIVSYLMSLSGAYIISGFLLIAAAVFLIIRIYGRKKDIMDPSILYAAGLILAEGIAAFKLSYLNRDWSLFCWISFYLSYLLFYIFKEKGEAFALKSPIKKRTKIKIGILKKMDLERYIAISIVSLICISLLSFVFEAIHLKFIPFFTKDTPHAYSYFHVKGIHYFTCLNVLVPPIAVIYALRGGKNRIITLLGIIIPLILSVLMLSRFQIIYTFILSVFVYYIGKSEVKIRNLILLFLGVIIIYLLISRLRAHSVEYLNEIFEMKNKSIPIFISQPYMYISNNFENFNIMTGEIKQHSYGLKSMYPFLTLTCIKFIKHIDFSFPLFISKKELTTLTILYDVYYDFHIFGIAGFSAILGFFSGYLREKIKTRKNPYIKLIYVQIAFYLLFAFFTTWFSLPVTWFYIGVSIIFSYIWDIMVEEKNET